jgi:2,3-bisphosphoglycerate-dependent phosphoglycerate mutase
LSNLHLTFLRHGESIGNRDGIVQGQADFPLSETGVQQVSVLAEKWQQEDRQFDGIITSPLKRARQTAEIIAEKLGKEISENSLLQERNRGKFSGLPREEAYSNGKRMDLVPRHVQPGETGESTAQIAIRAGYAVQSLMKLPPGKYLVVSHGAFLSALFHIIHNIKKVSDEQGVHFVILNTGYAEYEYDSDRNQWVMLGLTQPITRIPIYSQYDDLYRFVFLRHGQSEGNVQRMFQGQFETPLTELGRTQAIDAGRSLKGNGYKFDAIITSPLERALETAKLINAEYDAPLTTDDRLKEIHNGVLAGMKINDIIEKFGDEKRPDRNNPYIPIGETGESQLELYLRATEMVDALLQNPPGEYLIVSHGGLVNNITLSILGAMPVPRSRPTWLMFSNTSFVEFGYSIQENLWKFFVFSPYVGH